MKLTIKYYLILIQLCLIACCSFSQQNNIDSLLRLIKKDQLDTTKIIHLNELAWQIMFFNPDSALTIGNNTLTQIEIIKGISKTEKLKFKAKTIGQIGTYNYFKADYKKALHYYFQALNLFKQIKNKNGIAIQNANIGIIYTELGAYEKALSYYFKALKVDKEFKNKERIAADYGNIGLVYHHQSNYTASLHYYFMALKLDEETNAKSVNKNSLATHLCNIANIYLELKNNEKALHYYRKALKVDKETGNIGGIAANLGGIGNVYKDQHKYKPALENYFESLKLVTQIGDKNGISRNLNRIGTIYCDQGDTVKAKEYYLKALALAKEINDISHEVILCLNLGGIALDQNKFKEAEPYFLTAVKYAHELGEREAERQNLLLLSKLYEKTKRERQALQLFRRATELKDSLFTIEMDKEITQKEMNYEFEKKTAKSKAINDRKAAVHKQKLAQKETERNYFIAGFVLVFILALFILRGFRQKQKANILISKQKEEVELKNLIIEEKQKEILDSIHYAKRIQFALLPSVIYIQKSLKRLTSS